MRVCILWIGITALCGSAFAGDKTDTPPKLVYGDIPARWNYYFLEPQIIEKYTGEAINEVCFDDDFIKNPDQFGTMKISGSGGRGASVSRNLRTLKGGSDFAVIGKNTLLINTEHTGVNVVETKYCRKALPRAKYLLLDDDVSRGNPNRCFKITKGFSLLTRQKSGLAVCEIQTINRWSGSMDVTKLKAENEGLKHSETE